MPWNYQRAAAERAITGLAGVTAVDNVIRIEPTLPFAAADARTNIAAAFAPSAQLDASNIDVRLRGTEIELTGSVSSLAEVRQAGDCRPASVDVPQTDAPAARTNSPACGAPRRFVVRIAADVTVDE